MIGRPWDIAQASLFCAVCAGLYVGSMYLIPRSVRSLPRDNVLHIKYRFVAVTIATLLSVVLFAVLVPITVLDADVVTALGLHYYPLLLRALLVTAGAMALFYLGPIATLLHFIAISHTSTVAPDGTLTPRSSVPSAVGYLWGEVLPNFCSQFQSVLEGSDQSLWMNYRGLIYGPVTEEIVFRAVMVPALYIALAVPTAANVVTNAFTSTAVSAVYSPWTVVWVNPLCFGVAHLHHFVEKVSTGTPVGKALVTTLVQLLYTSIFGVIATLLFMRTGSIYCALLSHIICNSVGLPDVSFCNVSGTRQSDHYSCLYAYRYVHLFLHSLGLVLFTVLIVPLTEQFTAGSVYWR